ncbi:hypothetical protein GCM10009836_30820 [Pseudonocardia ailaonensis]|uniref:DUF3040 domain-containing protein n=1 Tax=Pseudonocardia ailaonensis TaxID=367279 RepID=A0ABN2N322_9PSEU
MLDGAEWQALRAIELNLEREDPALAEALTRGVARAPAHLDDADARIELLGAALVILIGAVAAVAGAATLTVGLMVAAVVVLVAGVMWAQRARRLLRGDG